MAGSTDRLFKVLVIGDVGVGKSSIVVRYVKKRFGDNYKPSIGVDFALKTIEWDARTVVRLQFWDIAGQERFRKLSRVYYKEAMGALVVFDITNRSTLRAASEWKQDLDSKVSQDSGDPVPAVLLANKCDMMAQRDRDNMVSFLDDFCRDFKFQGWFETSAKDNVNIDEAGAFLIKQMMSCNTDLSDGQRRWDCVRVEQASGASPSFCC